MKPTWYIQTFLKDVSFSLLWTELIVNIPYSYAESENTTNSFDLNGNGASQVCTENQHGFAKVKPCYMQIKIFQIWLQPVVNI